MLVLADWNVRAAHDVLFAGEVGIAADGPAKIIASVREGQIERLVQLELGLLEKLFGPAGRKPFVDGQCGAVMDFHVIRHLQQLLVSPFGQYVACGSPPDMAELVVQKQLLTKLKFHDTHYQQEYGYSIFLKG